jgi:hypothetical protein
MSKSMPPAIDPFRARQVRDVAGRFTRERAAHERQASLMWLGTLAAMFTDHELGLLWDLGFLCPRDLDLLRQASRLPAEPSTPRGKPGDNGGQGPLAAIPAQTHVPPVG